MPRQKSIQNRERKKFEDVINKGLVVEMCKKLFNHAQAMSSQASIFLFQSKYLGRKVLAQNVIVFTGRVRKVAKDVEGQRGCMETQGVEVGREKPWEGLTRSRPGPRKPWQGLTS